MLSFFCKAPLALTAGYADPDVSRIHRGDQVVGQCLIQGVKPSAQGEVQKVEVKVRVNAHGVFEVVSATLMEKQQVKKFFIVFLV